MCAHFHLSEGKSGMALKSVSGAMKGGRGTITLVVEALNLDDFGYALRELELIRKAHQGGKPPLPPKGD